MEISIPGPLLIHSVDQSLRWLPNWPTCFHTGPSPALVYLLLVFFSLLAISVITTLLAESSQKKKKTLLAVILFPL